MKRICSKCNERIPSGEEYLSDDRQKPSQVYCLVCAHEWGLITSQNGFTVEFCSPPLPQTGESYHSMKEAVRARRARIHQGYIDVRIVPNPPKKTKKG